MFINKKIFPRRSPSKTVHGNYKSIKIDKTWKPFFISISLIIILFLSGIFFGLIIRTKQLIDNQILTAARTHFQNIVLTRRWNAQYNGVFVLKTEGVVSNPYLVNPDIEDVDGRIYTKKNPALMTREISEYAREAGDFVFHITSLRPLNPNNQPYDFEQRALLRFNEGIKEIEEIHDSGQRIIYRYMAPLETEKSCLACHAIQGYKVGDIRGGISVSFDITDLKKNLNDNKIAVILLSIITTMTLLMLVYIQLMRFRRKLTAAYEAIETMSITDELTGLYNRHHFNERLAEETGRAVRHHHPLSLAIFDLDFFKKVNDNYGHPAGDEVLKQVAQIIQTNGRKSDPVSRYGGEEFVVILPETNLEGSETAAENIRRAIEDHLFDLGDGRTTRVTVSIGTACLPLKSDHIKQKEEWLINHADEALFWAKKCGRNQVVAWREGLKKDEINHPSEC